LISGGNLGISYHAIYNVEWLGWDLVEPLTYTGSMGVTIILMWYMLNNRGLEDVRNNDILNYKINKGYYNHHKKAGYISYIDKHRKQMLQEQL
jgi:hypothetical protein